MHSRCIQPHKIHSAKAEKQLSNRLLKIMKKIITDVYNYLQTRRKVYRTKHSNNSPLNTIQQTINNKNSYIYIYKMHVPIYTYIH